MLEIWTMCCGYLSAAIRLAHEEEAAAAKAAALLASDADAAGSATVARRPTKPILVSLRGKSIALRESRPPL
jgi:hypothetical protein